MQQEKTIFEEVQARYDILEVAAELGIDLRRVGSTYRASSIAKDGGGEIAFTVYPDSNSWYDFKLNIGGDITDLVAFVKFDGDKKQALLELLPDHAQQIDRFRIVFGDQYIPVSDSYKEDVQQYLDKHTLT